MRRSRTDTRTRARRAVIDGEEQCPHCLQECMREESYLCACCDTWICAFCMVRSGLEIVCLVCHQAPGED